MTGRYGVTRFIVGLILGHTPKDGAAVTAVYDRHTYIPEKREALLKWADHLTGASSKTPAPGFQTNTASAAAPASSLEAAKTRALALCAEGQRQQAVMTMCMAASREGSMSANHLDVIAAVGIDLASRNDWSDLESWIEGFG